MIIEQWTLTDVHIVFVEGRARRGKQKHAADRTVGRAAIPVPTRLFTATRVHRHPIQNGGLNEGNSKGTDYLNHSSGVSTSFRYTLWVVASRLRNRNVRSHRRRELDYFFAYPEDYSQQQIEWIYGAFGRRPHTPAFEVVFVYSRRDGTLDLNFDGPYRAVEPLQGMFATAILQLERLPPDPSDESVYDLEPLGRRGFAFVYDVGSGIEQVVVQKLRFASRGMPEWGDLLLAEGGTDRDRAVEAAVQPGEAARRVGVSAPGSGDRYPKLEPGSTTPGCDVNSLTTAGTKYRPRQSSLIEDLSAPRALTIV